MKMGIACNGSLIRMWRHHHLACHASWGNTRLVTPDGLWRATYRCGGRAGRSESEHGRGCDYDDVGRTKFVEEYGGKAGDC